MPSGLHLQPRRWGGYNAAGGIDAMVVVAGLPVELPDLAQCVLGDGLTGWGPFCTQRLAKRLGRKGLHLVAASVLGLVERLVCALE